MTKAEKTRQFIIEKSAPIFNVKGVAATAMSDIMEATNLAKGSLYTHFENKEELSYCAVDYTLKSFADKITEAVNKAKTAKGKLIAFIDAFTDSSNPVIAGGCPMLNFGIEADDTNSVIRKKVNKAIEGVHQSIADIIESGIKNNEFIKTWNAKEFAIKAFAMIEGGILINRVAGNNDKMKVILRILKNEIEEKSI